MTSKMTINKYQGKTKEEAIEKAKQELGEGAVVMNVRKSNLQVCLKPGRVLCLRLQLQEKKKRIL